MRKMGVVPPPLGDDGVDFAEEPSATHFLPSPINPISILQFSLLFIYLINYPATSSHWPLKGNAIFFFLSPRETTNPPLQETESNYSLLVSLHVSFPSSGSLYGSFCYLFRLLGGYLKLSSRDLH